MTVLRPRGSAAALLACFLSTGPAFSQSTMPLLPSGTVSGLPLVEPNGNTAPAGTVGADGVREIALEVARADWRPETPDGPGLRVAAVAEAGRAPTIPAPLIRVRTGTRVRVRVRNALDDAPLTVFGLHTRPSAAADSFTVGPRGEETVEFDAGEPGTYLYWMREGLPPEPGTRRFGVEQDQLAGALVVDPEGEPAAERILVINIFSWRAADTLVAGDDYLEALTINGRSWPFTERFAFAVGEPVRWRVVNASDRVHPMHLHGFYYNVLSRGTTTGDTIYAPADHRLVVTETMLPKTTMLMEWSPSRPGTWLFHCHLSFHVAPEIRLPGAEGPHDHGTTHMAGLVVGIEVAPGPSDLVRVGEPTRIALYANEYGEENGYRYGYAFDADFVADSLTDVPGPLLLFNRHQGVDVTVHNRLSVPTGVHWHGLELDAWADGVPGYSRSDGRVSPAIAPGDSFTYRLSLMRAGTFIYHSHLDDVHQLSGGLYGGLIVLPEGDRFDPRRDHVMIAGWNTPKGGKIEYLDLNGRRMQPRGAAKVGERHRFRIINIAPAGRLSAWITREDGATVPITLYAKDGADLPPQQRTQVQQLPRLGVGETFDFTWMPTAAGTYVLHIGYGPGPDQHLVQVWEVGSP